MFELIVGTQIIEKYKVLSSPPSAVYLKLNSSVQAKKLKTYLSDIKFNSIQPRKQMLSSTRYNKSFQSN